MMKKLIIFLLGSWLMLGIYSCKAKQGCDCPTFGNHATGKNGYLKTNGSNHRNR